MKAETVYTLDVPGFENVLFSEVQKAIALPDAFEVAQLRGRKLQSLSQAVAACIDGVVNDEPVSGRHWTRTSALYLPNGSVAFDDEIMQDFAQQGFVLDKKEEPRVYVSLDDSRIVAALDRANKSGRVVSDGSKFLPLSSHTREEAFGLLKANPYFRAAAPKLVDSLGAEGVRGIDFGLVSFSSVDKVRDGQVRMSPCRVEVSQSYNKIGFGSTSMFYDYGCQNFRDVIELPVSKAEKTIQTCKDMTRNLVR